MTMIDVNTRQPRIIPLLSAGPVLHVKPAYFHLEKEPNEERTMSDESPSMMRRTLLQSAGLGIGALALGVPGSAEAQTQAPEAIWSAEYWAQKGPVKLNLWRKRQGAPRAGETPKPVLFLVHGSSNSARSSYDLSVPGKGTEVSDYSMM